MLDTRFTNPSTQIAGEFLKFIEADKQRVERNMYLTEFEYFWAGKHTLNDNRK